MSEESEQIRILATGAGQAGVPLPLSLAARIHSLRSGIPREMLYAIVAYAREPGQEPLLVVSQGATGLELAAAILAGAPDISAPGKLVAHHPALLPAQLGFTI